MSNKTTQNKKNHGKEKNEPELKGTLISVLALGAFILISWFIVFNLFVSR